jgi:chromate transporter
MKANLLKGRRMMPTCESYAPSFWAILWSFLKLAPISFGGGYAIFPALEREIVETRKWMDERTFSETLSLAAASPGGVGVNAAILVGYRLRGLVGSVAASLGAVVPTAVIVWGVFLLYAQFGESAKVEAALTGVIWGITTLILYAALRIGRKAIKDKTTGIMMLGALGCLLADISPVTLIFVGIAAGFVVSWLAKSQDGRHGRCSFVSVASKGRADPDYMYFI